MMTFNLATGLLLIWLLRSVTGIGQDVSTCRSYPSRQCGSAALSRSRST